jgi:hypothetical protein
MSIRRESTLRRFRRLDSLSGPPPSSRLKNQPPRYGTSILILDQRSSIVPWFQGEGVPQKRLMRADDSCRVENAEASVVPA